MGTVITAVFRKQPPYDYHEESALIDAAYVTQNEPRVEEARLLIEEANVLLFEGGQTTPNFDEIDHMREKLSFHSIEELCDLMMKLPKDDWKENVEYIGALTLEYQRRLDCAMFCAEQYFQAHS